MLPEQPISFPEFVADQLLTAKNLNDLFHYLDVQERGTRINLIGIGIVCGLELKINAAGTEIIITKGCGITSQGYLVRWDETKFENYKAYDAAKELVYPPFYSGGQQKFDIDELKSNSSEEGITKLTKAYLDDKVALLFVELLRIDAKNCDPESCDDKGSNITLTIRPLLVKKSDAVYLTGGVAAGNSFNQTWISLPELKMPRHHVPAEDLFDSGDVFAGFQKELGPAFLSNIEKILSQTYARLLPLVKDMYASNPFTGTAAKFAFVHNGTMTVQQLLYMQYYYDLFSDVIYAYEELRRSGMKLLSLCCPDENLFPRHLLLGVTGASVSKVKLDFRHYFIPSPAVACHRHLVDEIRVLFKRIVLLLQRFVFDDKVTGLLTNNTIAVLNRATRLTPIRITPSKHGDVPLSEKAIPFYYDVASGTDKLFQHWSIARSLQGTAHRNLSYHANQYNTGDDDVLQPLQYDLEPHNFLRIEGHIGHRYTEALATINQIRDTNRLPFDVIALSADIKTLREMLAGIANSTNYANLREGFPTDITVGCHFQDLEALYDTMAQGLLCNLCKEMKYYYDTPRANDNQTADLVPQIPLLRKCDPAFRYRAGTLGDRFEQFWKTVSTQPYITAEQFLAGNTGNSALSNETKSLTVFLPFLALMYFIEKLSEILPVTLISFNIVAFQRRYSDLLTIAQHIKNLYEQASSNDPNGTVNGAELMAREDFLDHLDALLYACRDAQFSALYNDYKVRWVYLAMLQKLGYYVKMHPGIQHKAGVPVGGTFILVYHERSRVRQPNTNIFTNRFTATVATKRAEDINIANRAEETEPAPAKSGAKSKKQAAAAESVRKAPAPKEGTQAETAASEAEQAQIAGNQIAGANISSAAYASVHQLQTSKLKASLTQKQMAIIDRLFFKDLITRHSLDELTAQLPDRIVIADFYLPYMCCSDCPPIYYIVNETAGEEPDQPTVSIKDTQYCGADEATYPITATPAGGSFGNSEGVTEANGVFSFKPAAVNIPENTLNKIIALTYTKDGLSASVNVTVFAKPQAAFDIIPATAHNFFVFANKSLRASSVTWDFGDGVTATGDNPSHVYAEDGTYTVSLKALNGVCSDTVSKTITVSRASVAVDGSPFCSADQSSYPISVSPQGGDISGEGTTKQATGFVFRPAGVAFSGTLGSKDILITYSLPGQSVSTSIKVFRTPSAVFTVNTAAGAGPNIRVFQTNNPFAAQYAWDFGDGTSSVEASPAHLFKEPGSYVVKLTATNGSCSASSSQTVVIAQPVSVNITPTQFCSIDRTSYPVTVSPLGGQLSGEGVSTGPNGFVFSPAAVAFGPEQTQKLIALVYNSAGQTAQVQVTVFQTPDATFAVTTSTAAPNARIFTPRTPLAASFNWDFGDGQTSNLQKPSHQYAQAGSFNVTLAVTNGTCKSSSSQTVTVGSDIQPTKKSCGPLEDVIAGFKALNKVSTAALFKSFTAVYEPFKEVQEYFSQLAALSGEPVEKQIDFFVETDIASLLEKWFSALNPLVQNSDVRTNAIALWRVLTELAMYVMCIQDNDFDKNKINLGPLFSQIESFIKGWSQFVANFSDEDKAQLKLLLGSMTAERERLTANGEATVKKSYATRLNNCIRMLTAYVK